MYRTIQSRSNRILFASLRFSDRMLFVQRVLHILHRLRNVRRSRSGWIARCPAHQDRSPSLAVSEGNRGRILLHCFSGCSVEAICCAVQIKLSDLFTEARAVKAKPSAVREAEKQIVDLRSRLTPRERVLPVTVVYCDLKNLDAGMARALALAVEGDIVQAVLEGA